MPALPDEMTFVRIDRPGPPDVLVADRGPLPKPQPGEVLIRVEAAGINRPDLLQREGAYPPPPGASPHPGLEVAGTIAAVGEGTERWREGDRVMALVPGGGYAEFCTTPGAQVLPIPDGLSMVEAGAVPETFFTVWSNVVDRGGLRSGETFLVHGGSSGIGTTAIQIAAMLGAKVITTVGSADKAAACLRLGASRAVNYRTEDFVEVVKEETAGRGVELILDMVGGPYVERNIAAAAAQGRIVQIAWLQGAKVTANFTPLMLKRLTWTGSTLRPRTIEEKGAIATALEGRVWPWLASGKVRPLIHATLPLAEAAKGHALMEEGDHIGKIVLTMGSA